MTLFSQPTPDDSTSRGWASDAYISRDPIYQRPVTYAALDVNTNLTTAIGKAGSDFIAAISLSSGSKGNAHALIVQVGRDKRELIFHDVGLTIDEFQSRLKEVGIILQSENACQQTRDILRHQAEVFPATGAFLSHRHADHANPGLLCWLVDHGVPVIASQELVTELEGHSNANPIEGGRKKHAHFLQGALNHAKSLGMLKILQQGGTLSTNSCLLRLGALTHDVPNSFMEVLMNGNHGMNVVWSSDTGGFTPELTLAARNAHAIVIEGNYNLDSIQKGNRPQSVTNRISGTKGHQGLGGLATWLSALSRGPSKGNLQVAAVTHSTAKLDEAEIVNSLLNAWDANAAGRALPAVVVPKDEARLLFVLSADERGQRVFIEGRQDVEGEKPLLCAPFGLSGESASLNRSVENRVVKAPSRLPAFPELIPCGGADVAWLTPDITVGFMTAGASLTSKVVRKTLAKAGEVSMLYDADLDCLRIYGSAEILRKISDPDSELGRELSRLGITSWLRLEHSLSPAGYTPTSALIMPSDKSRSLRDNHKILSAIICAMCASTAPTSFAQLQISSEIESKPTIQNPELKLRWFCDYQIAVEKQSSTNEKRKIRYSSVPLIVVRLKPNLDQLTQSISVSVRLPIGESAKLEPAITALANALDQFKPAKGSDRLSWNQKIKSAEAAATYIFSADYTSAEPNRDLYSIADIARQITRDFGLLSYC